MKKYLLILVLLGIFCFSNSVQAQSAYNQLNQAASDGQSASGSYSNGSYDYEGSRATSGYGFDSSSSSPPAVDLSGASDNPTPQLLRGSDNSNPYTPQRYRSLKTNPPPPPSY